MTHSYYMLRNSYTDIHSDHNIITYENNKQLLDEVFVISEIINVEVSFTYRDLDN
jgi:hypothetical protein